MNSLLTPKEVANLPSISLRTVYDNALELGGFYPGGIKVLRFNPEVIHGFMEGQDVQELGIRVQLPGEKVRGAGVQYQEGSRGRASNTPRRGQGTSQRG